MTSSDRITHDDSAAKEHREKVTKRIPALMELTRLPGNHIPHLTKLSPELTKVARVYFFGKPAMFREASGFVREVREVFQGSVVFIFTCRTVEIGCRSVVDDGIVAI